MAQQGTSATDGFWRSLLRGNLYKRTQGRIARQITFGVLAVVVGLGAWSLTGFLADRVHRWAQLGVPACVAFALWWVAFRLVNMPRFADFLISVEAEMSKVSWPSKRELWRSSLVVLITMFGLAAVLFFYDFFWKEFLELLGVLHTG